MYSLKKKTASGKRQLVFRSTPAPQNATGNKQQPPSVSIEVWGEGRCLLELCVPSELHGPIYSGAWFGDGGPSWSGDEDRVAYVAERPAKETTPEWGREAFLFSNGVPSDASSVGADGGATQDSKSLLESKHAPLPKPWRGLGAAVEDWGEQLTGMARPGVFVLDIPSATVLSAPAPPPSSKGSAADGEGEEDEDSSSSSQGQPALSPCGRAVVFVSWPHRDERLYPGLGKQ